MCASKLLFGKKVERERERERERDVCVCERERESFSSLISHVSGSFDEMMMQALVLQENFHYRQLSFFYIIFLMGSCMGILAEHTALISFLLCFLSLFNCFPRQIDFAVFFSFFFFLFSFLLCLVCVVG